MNRSPLGRLAPELRNHIYELVFSPPNEIDIYVVRKGVKPSTVAPSPPVFTGIPETEPRHIHLSTTKPQMPALTRTCKQIRKETSGLTHVYYAETTFHFHALPFNQSSKRSIYEGVSRTASRSYSIPSEYCNAANGLFEKWYHALIWNASGYPPAVHFHLGTWNMSVRHPIDVDQLWPQVNIPQSTKTEVYYVLMVRYAPEAHTKYGIQQLCLPVNDTKKALDVISTTIKAKSQQLRESWQEGLLTMAQYSAMQGALHQCRLRLNTCVSSKTRYAIRHTTE